MVVVLQATATTPGRRAPEAGRADVGTSGLDLALPTGQTLLKDLDLTLPKGAWTLISGSSGSGLVHVVLSSTKRPVSPDCRIEVITSMPCSARSSPQRASRPSRIATAMSARPAVR